MVEVLVATLLLSVSLVPAVNALRVSVLTTAANKVMQQEHFQLQRKLNFVLAQRFSDLHKRAGVHTTHDLVLSDPVGTEGQALVYLSRFDADNADGDDDPFTGKDPFLLWVRVELEGSDAYIEELVSNL